MPCRKPNFDEAICISWLLSGYLPSDSLALLEEPLSLISQFDVLDGLIL